jgi:hypothetical protein
LRKAREWLPGSGVRQQARPDATSALDTPPPKDSMTTLRAVKHNLTRIAGATMQAASLIVLTLLGLVAVAIPAALAIAGMELVRARRWLRDPKLIWLTRKTPRA